VLTIESDGRIAARGELAPARWPSDIEAFFALFCADELAREPPKVLHAPATAF